MWGYVLGGAVLSGAMATSLILVMSLVGSKLDEKAMRAFAALLIAVIAARIGAFGTLPLEPNIVVAKGITYVSIMMFSILLIGLLVSLLRGPSPVQGKGEPELLLFLMLLPSIDGAIFTLASQGQIDIRFPLMAVLVGSTVLSGPGSMSLATRLSSTFDRKKAVQFVLKAGAITTGAAAVVSLLGHFVGSTNYLFDTPIFARIASVAIFLAAILVYRTTKISVMILSILVVCFALLCAMSSCLNTVANYTLASGIFLWLLASIVVDALRNAGFLEKKRTVSKAYDAATGSWVEQKTAYQDVWNNDWILKMVLLLLPWSLLVFMRPSKEVLTEISLLVLLFGGCYWILRVSLPLEEWMKKTASPRNKRVNSAREK